LYFRATSLIGAISAIWPKRCTGITAFILLSLPSLLSESSLTSKEAGSRLKVLGSISTKTGLAPTAAIASAVAKKVNAVVMTSSPAPIPQSF